MSKAALLGANNKHSAGHLRTLDALPEVEGIVLWDEDTAALAALRESAPSERVEATYTDLDELLAQQDVSWAIAALRPDTNPPICRRVLAAGKHILSEKPLGRRAADVESLVVAAERAELQLGVCYLNRYHPVTQQARAWIREGAIGALMSVEMRLITTQVKKRDPRHWLFRDAQSGGGILAWLGCHYIDLMRYLTGDEVVSVMAEVATRSGEEIDVEDIATVSLRFRSGAVGSLHAGYVLALSGEGYFNQAGYDSYIGLNGQAGRMYWTPTATAPCLHIESTAPAFSSAPIWELHLPSLPPSSAYGGVYGEAMVRDFIRATRGECPVPASGRDALQAQQIIDAAYESSRTGRRVAVPPPT